MPLPFTYGGATRDGSSLQQLYTRFEDTIVRVNEGTMMGGDFRSMFCNLTQDKAVRVLQRSAEMQEMGSDTARPDVQHLDAPEFDLPEPRRFANATAVTRERMKRGLSSLDITNGQDELLRGDTRILVKAVLYAALLKNGLGWWDATQTFAPPKYGGNPAFTTSHNHYLADNAGGILRLDHLATGKQHMLEHGYEGQIIALINSAQMAEVEKQAPWGVTTASVTAGGPAYIAPTSLIGTLQQNGFTPDFRAAGVNVYHNEFIPPNYMLMFAMDGTKPMMWRNPENDNGELEIIAREPDDVWMQYITIQRYISCRVTQRGQGVAYYLNSGTWSDPSITLGTGSYVTTVGGGA